MEKIRCLIVDDEKPARRRLTELLEREPKIDVCGVGTSGSQAVELIRKTRPELLFLDVQMPDRDGFEVLEEVGPEAMPVTVFVTAYDKYAIRAFEAHALDYLLKPFSDERFEHALDRARREIETRRGSALSERLLALIASRPGQAASARPAYLERLVIKTGGRVFFLPTAEIDWIEAAGVYVELHVGPKTHLYRATLGEMEQKLDPRRFVRIHRSTILNMDRLREMQPLTRGEYAVVLENGAELKLSRTYRARLEEWLGRPL